MSIAPTSLIDPLGPILLAFFPGDDSATLIARVQGYITDGESLVGTLDVAVQDAATINYTLWRAYDAAHNVLLLRPNRLKFDGKGESEFSASQVSAIGEKALMYKTMFDAFFAVTSRSTIPLTTFVPNRPIW